MTEKLRTIIFSTVTIFFLLYSFVWMFPTDSIFEQYPSLKLRMILSMDYGLEYSLYLIVGAVAGTLSGLLGIGGGLIVVPVLILWFSFFSADFNVMQAATGTSLAIMIFTTLSGLVAHNKKRAIDWVVIRYLGLGVIFGALGGRLVSGFIPTFFLSIIFTMFVASTAYKMFFKKTNTLEELQKTLPSIQKFGLYGVGIGLCSSLLGLGGFLTVPVLVKFNYKSQVAAACAVVTGFIIAITSSLVSIFNGFFSSANLNVGGMFGNIYIPAFIGIAIASISFAPLGAEIAHKISSKLHRKIFAVFLVFVIIEMLINIYRNI